MPENESGQEKTEKPSERRRREAREKGNVAKSAEVNSAFIILAGTGFLFISGGGLLSGLKGLLVQHLTLAPTRTLAKDQFAAFFADQAVTVLQLIGPLLLTISVIGVLVNLGQFGFIWSMEAVSPKFDKLNIISGVKRLFSLRSIVELVKNLIKLAVIAMVVYLTVQSRLELAYRMIDQPVGQILLLILQTGGEVLLKTALVLLFFALADYAYQRYEYEKNLRMTKEELKEENKMTEGNPQIKARVREIQRAVARRRMMSQVPEADVVITNPVHYAVALKYEPAKHHAPLILAKGERKIAQKIKEIALSNKIPIVEDPPLARLLFREGEVGREVPIKAYQAVAEILGYVYRLQNRKMDLN